MTDFQKGYSTSINDVLQLLLPITKSFEQYHENNDLVQMITDFTDALGDISALSWRNA